MSTSYITAETPAGDSEAITVSTNAIGFTATKILVNATGGRHRRAVRAFVTVEDQPIRVLWTGTAPTSTVGHKLNNGDSIMIEGEANVLNFKAIRASTATGDAALQVTYFFIN